MSEARDGPQGPDMKMISVLARARMEVADRMGPRAESRSPSSGFVLVGFCVVQDFEEDVGAGD